MVDQYMIHISIVMGLLASSVHKYYRSCSVAGQAPLLAVLLV